MHRHLLLWWCSSKEGDGSFFAIAFFFGGVKI
jgi:hypothetical protein